MASVGSGAGWRSRPEIVLAGLSLLSGIASARLVLDSSSPYVPPLRPLALVFGLAPEHMPPGLYFGAAVAVGTFIWTRKVWSLPVLLVTTMYAWSAAIQVAIRLQRHTGDDAYLVAASLAAGAVGAVLTHLGCALFAPGLRRLSRIAVSCVVGALAGMLLYMSERKLVDMQWLFIVWQPAVACAIGAGLGRAQRA